MASKSNILLIILDSLRARNVDIYDYDRRTMPFLREYSAKATLCRHARSASIHSVASHASMWTGQSVAEHKACSHHSFVPPDDTVWADLSDSGYQTGLFTGNVIVTKTSNLSAPFDYVVTDNYVDPSQKLFEKAFHPMQNKQKGGWLGNLKMSLADEYPIKSLANTAYHLSLKQKNRFVKNKNSRQYIQAFLRWQRKQRGPWAACINFMDTHYPYQPAPEYDQWDDGTARSIQKSIEGPMSQEFASAKHLNELAQLSNLYDGAIREADAHVRKLIQELKKIGDHDNTLIIVTSDHGEGFGEQSLITDARMVDHSWGLHEVLTHVPLVVKYPNQTEGNEIIEPVSLMAFRDTAHAVSNGDVEIDSFVQDYDVVASTNRLNQKDGIMFEASEISPADYFGPWRAVYRFEDGIVRKYINRGNRSAIIDIPSAQKQIFNWGDDCGVVDEAFDKFVRDQEGLETPEIGKPNKAIEDRLSELGYLT